MIRTKRFQNRITAGRFTLPAAILISVTCWILTTILLPHTEPQLNDYPLWETFSALLIPAWGNRIFSFVLYAVIGYFLIEINNTFALIRMRASVQTTIYFMLIAVCPSIHTLYAGDLASAALLIALFFLFKSYQQTRPTGYLFHAFVFIGVGSLIFPQLMLFIPIFWIGAYNFQSLRFKSFLASLIGWSVPYWFLLGHALFHGQMELFYQPFRELITFTPIQFELMPWKMATIGYLLTLFLVSATHCLVTSYEDKIRTRSYLHFLILLNFCLLAFLGLQPALSVHLLPLLFIGVSILAGHLFSLTSSRSSNLFFICMFLGIFLLFGFNVWTLL